MEQTNEDDAIVKWDDDGRTRLHQPWLKEGLAHPVTAGIDREKKHWGLETVAY